jgi:hypothetical protein
MLGPYVAGNPRSGFSEVLPWFRQIAIVLARLKFSRVMSCLKQELALLMAIFLDYKGHEVHEDV